MADAGGVSSQQPLYEKYPISSQWEFKLKNGESVKGEVYCTDPIAEIVVIQDSENDIRMISLSSIEGESRKEDDSTIEQKKIDTVHVKKVLEEREKRAIRLAQESLKHLNPKAPPKGQIVFDRLLKACNDVVWKNDSIVVLDSIIVDPPYTRDDCKPLKSAKQQGSLDRVQKIVSSITG
jgi:small nuclear ribonucleoprotein (snRNP)-like protein